MFDLFTSEAPIVIEDPNAGQPDDTGATDAEETVPVADEVVEADPKAEVDDEGQAEDKEEPKAEEEITPDWRSKYESPEKMYEALSKIEKSYNNLRPEFTKKAMELADIKKQAGTVASDLVLPTELKNPDDVVNLIVNAVKMQTEKEVAPIKAQAEQLEMENTINRLSRHHKDFDQYGEAILKVLGDNQYLWQGGTEKALENAYKIAKAESSSASVESLVAKTLADKDAINDIKKKVSAERPKSATPATSELSPEDEISESILNVSKKKNSLFF